MKKWWMSWVSFWAEPDQADAMAIFRILMSLTLLQLWFTELWTGAGQGIYTSFEHGGLAPKGAAPDWLMALGGATDGAIVAILWVAVALTLALLAGVGGWITPLLLGQWTIMIFGLHSGTGGGHDRLITNGLWLLVFAQSHRTWSLSARLKTGQWAPVVEVPAWPRRLMIFQIILMYFLTGINKQGSAWFASGDYRALYDTFLLPSWSKYDMTWIGDIFPFLQLSTIAAWWWEAGFLALLFWYWAKRTDGKLGRLAKRYDLRIPLLVTGLFVHTSLWIIMNLGPFSPITIAFYAAFLTPEDVNGIRKRLGLSTGPAHGSEVSDRELGVEELPSGQKGHA